MVVVLITAAGADWESPALRLLDTRPDLVVLKRCVDVDDLLATASAGQADVAVVALDAPGLDVTAVDDLRRYGVRPIAVVASAHADRGRLRAGRIGVRSVAVDDALPGLLELLAHPEPAAPPTPPSSQLTARLSGAAPPQPADPPTTPPNAPPTYPPPAIAPVAPTPDSEAVTSGRVIVVWGPAGAPGRTTVATALADALSRRSRTTLVDADPYGGSVAQVLGVLDEVSGVLAAARLAGAGRLAEEFSGVQRALDPTLTVVTGLPRADRWPEVRSGTVEALLETAAGHGHAVADTGFCLEDQAGAMGSRPGRNQMTLGALSAADEVVAVGTADPVGLARLARGLVDLRDVVGATPIRVVVNRMRPSLGWSEREVAEMVTGLIRIAGLQFLPEDRATADRALVSGCSLRETAPESPLVRAVDRLADALAPGTPAAARRRDGPRLRRRTAGRARRR